MLLSHLSCGLILVLTRTLYKWDTTTMENIEAFYALAFKYGFINRKTYLQIILKISLGRIKKEQRPESGRTYSTLATFEPIACKV